MLFQGACSPKEADMAAGHDLLYDLRRGCPKIFASVENLFGRGDVIVGARQQEGRANDIVEIELSPSPMNCP